MIRLLFIGIWVFIQALWTLTTKGANIKNFFRTFVNAKSMFIVLFEVFSFFQVLLPLYSSMSLDRWNSFLEIFGIIVALIGTMLASWAKLVMGKNWGRPAQHDKNAQSSLVTTGPFTFSRNPLYIGLFLIFIGQQISLHSYFILLALPFYLAIRKAVATEETLLEKHFGESYRSYKSRVPRFL